MGKVVAMIVWASLILAASVLPLTGCSPAPQMDLSTVDKSVDQAVEGAKGAVDAANQLTDTAKDIADKANKALDLGKQAKDVLTK